MPADYQRRQSLVSAERFVTPELKEREALILTAEARVDELERELFLGAAAKDRGAGGAAARDASRQPPTLTCWRRWPTWRPIEAGARPRFDETRQLQILGGRHPVLEALLPGGDVVPNDCRLGGDGRAPC